MFKLLFVLMSVQQISIVKKKGAD